MGGSAVQGDEPSRGAAAGDSVGGFTLVRQLGAGGMGETWEAVRQVGREFEQRVAVKLGSPELLRHPEGRELLRREASLAASLRHPNIASVLDWNEERGYIVCELVEGADLRAVMREAPGGRLSPPLLVHMIVQIARGLSHAHRRLLRGEPSPVIHRDMSPGNVVVDYDGNLKIVDFGIAKAVGSADWSQTIKGKLSYMAPEQATGGSLDGRVDQYALGVIAYEAATAARPNDGAHDGETLAKILDGAHVPLGRLAPSLPSGLVEIIERMLSLHADDRFPSMDAVIDALEPLTPVLTIHRSMASLVHRAHPPHTIVQEGGKFVSRRVITFELPANDPLGLGLLPTGQPHTPSTVRARASLESGASGPNQAINPFGETEGVFRYPGSQGPAQARFKAEAGARPQPRTGRSGGRAGWAFAAVAVVSAAIAWAAFSMLPGLRAPATPRSPVTAVPEPATPFAPPVTAPDPAVTAVVPAPPASEPPAAEAASERPELDPPRAERQADREGSTRRANAAQKRPPAARAGEATATTGTATVRVRVFPWGRVWIDGKLRGSVPPILSAKVSPGTHTIAVGQEHPGESRVVTIRAGEEQLVSFDIESW